MIEPYRIKIFKGDFLTIKNISPPLFLKQFSTNFEEMYFLILKKKLDQRGFLKKKPWKKLWPNSKKY